MNIRILLVALVLVLAFVALAPTPVSAQFPFCGEHGLPGHTEYAQHHIVLLAHSGMLGNVEGGHVPGFHQGYSACK